jgi:uncharacterized protein YxeA
MKRITKVLICLALITGSSAYAQIDNATGTLNNTLRITGQYKDTEGSPYLIDDYKNGILYDTKGKARSVFLKYDTYKEEVEVYNDGNPLLIEKRLYPKFVIEYIDAASKKKIHYEFTNEIQIPGLKPNKYVQIITDGDRFKLIKIYSSQLNQSQDQGYGGVITNNYFENKEAYYIYTVGLDAVPIKLKNKDILKALSDDGKLKDYLKKEKIKIRNEKDMSELMDYLNTGYLTQ